jgi:membrane-bound lytic murein transglycosylase B
MNGKHYIITLFIASFLLQSCGIAKKKNKIEIFNNVNHFTIKKIGIKNQYKSNHDNLISLAKIKECNENLKNTPLNADSINEQIIDNDLISSHKLTLKQKAELYFLNKRELTFAVKTIDGLNYIKKPALKNSSQLELKLLYKDYKSKVLTRAKQENALVFLQKNINLLNQIEKLYGVDKEVVVALFTLESDLGKIKGTHKIIDALFSLSLSPSLSVKRRSFFESELFAIIKIIYYNIGIDNEVKGSWAGAFGLVQFMPSTFLKFAVDFDGDGKINLMSEPDALASASNYLMSIGWQPKKKLAKWIDVDKKNLCLSGTIYEDGHLVFIDKNNTDSDNAIIAYNNYFMILDWNRSLFFATSVFELSEYLKNHNT